MEIIDNTTNYHQVAEYIITTGATTITTSGCHVKFNNLPDFQYTPNPPSYRFNDTTKFIYNGNNTYTSTTFKTYFNEQLVKTEINDDSVVFIYKALKNWSFSNETLCICFKDVYKVINNKLVKQERIFGKVEPAKTIEETYLFD
jgi:hypothetical protein